jgi:hypothetical protein
MKNISTKINSHFNSNVLSEYELKIKQNIGHLLGGELRKKCKIKLISKIHQQLSLHIRLWLYL